MDEYLVGYLLNALDPETQRQVEAHLRDDPEAGHRLDLLRRALQPLAADAEEEPPPGLCVRTLGYIAHDQCRHRADRPVRRPLPRAPWPVGDAEPGRSWWRRADVLVAAVLLFACLGMGASLLPGLWQRQQIYACQNNLRLFGQALAAYSQNHAHQFPKVEAGPPRNVAGIFVPMLHDAGVLQGDVTVSCPSSGSRQVPSLTLAQLEELRQEQPAAFRDVVRRLAGCYAYTLGYGCPEDHHGLHDTDDDHLPLLADRPADGVGDGNSPNHGGLGQNVLYIDGHVRFCTSRSAGVNGDDIFLNQDRKVGAGCNPLDSVLGASAATPYPPAD
jgi:prepilin-type processing-associated H-X9-DG protein